MSPPYYQPLALERQCILALAEEMDSYYTVPDRPMELDLSGNNKPRRWIEWTAQVIQPQRFLYYSNGTYICKTAYLFPIEFERIPSWLKHDIFKATKKGVPTETQLLVKWCPNPVVSNT